MKPKLKLIILLFGISLVLPLIGTSQGYYWVAFTDKSGTSYCLDRPEEFLSARALTRRSNQSIPIDSLDIPVNSHYIDSVLQWGLQLVHSSKWLNGITVKCEDESFPKEVLQYSFVDSVEYTKPLNVLKSGKSKFVELSSDEKDAVDTSLYGLSVYQTGLLNGQFLHNLEYKGAGKVIAVLDAGFLNADDYVSFDSLWHNNRILGVRDFVNPDSDIYSEHYHGTSVLSCMGGNVPGQLIGTAPEASFWLLRSEDDDSEYLIEEDNWVVAAEFADSVGADIINSSLGYYEFHDSSMDHTYGDMDGNTTRVTMAANVAVSRGILVFSSAGNEGNNDWKYLIAPSDGDLVIGVGATNKFGFAASFSSRGPAADGDVKPNLAAVGWKTYLQLSYGPLGFSNGTSFSSPVLAGIAACLWQARPNSTAIEIKNALEKSAHQYNNPDSILGYGIPNMKTAYTLLGGTLVENPKSIEWNVYPNPFSDVLEIVSPINSSTQEVYFSLHSIDGRMIRQWENSGDNRYKLEGLDYLQSGTYLLNIRTNWGTETIVLIKTSTDG